MSRLTDLQLLVDAKQPAGMSFALLQGHLRQLFQGSDQAIAFKMDLVLYELYGTYYTLQKQYLEGSCNTKTLLTECNGIIQTCKSDREELFKLNQDRIRLIKDLQATTDESLQLMQQNEKLKKMVQTLQQLNQLLTKRYNQMEEQIKTIDKSGDMKDAIHVLSTNYKNIVARNEQMQKDLVQLSKQASIMQKFSLPIRVINVAFNSNNSLKELVIRQAEYELGVNKQLRDLFMNFKFDLGEVVQ